MNHMVYIVSDAEEDILSIYRIIYEVVESNVFVHCVLDGRRSLQELLEMRLLKR